MAAEGMMYRLMELEPPWHPKYHRDMTLLEQGPKHQRTQLIGPQIRRDGNGDLEIFCPDYLVCSSIYNYKY